MAVNILESIARNLTSRSWLLTFLLSFFILEGIWAQTTYYSRNTGNWTTNSTWSTVGFGSSINSGTFPGSGDIVFIGGGKTVTVAANAACASINFDAGTSITNTLNVNPSVTLAVSGTITIPQTVTSGSNILNADGGIVQAANLDFTASGSGAGHEVRIGLGTVDISGNISGVGASSTVSFTNTGILRVGGALFTPSLGTLITVAGSTVEYYGAAAQSVEAHTYSNLLISGNGIKTLSGTTVLVNSNLTVDPGSTLTIPGVTLSVGGLTTVHGSLIFTSTTGTKTFTGLVTVNGTWSNSGNETFTFRGGIINNGTFSAGSGAYYFTTNSQTLTGTFSLRVVVVTGASIELTNSNQLTVITSLTGSGRLVQASGAILNINGTNTISGLTATATGNTVNYTRTSAQTLMGGNYYHLGLSGSGIKTLLETTTEIAGDLTLGGTASASAVTGLTIGGSVTIGTGASFTSGNFTHFVSGNWSNTGTFTPGTGVIQLNGNNQTVGGSPTTFHDVRFSGAGTKTISVEATLSGTLYIDAGSILALSGITTHQANALVLDGSLQSATGTWGATGSGAANINDTYFSGAGNVNILTGGNTYYSRFDGDWNNNLTWSNTGFGGAPALSTPTASDNVIIGDGHSVTVTAAASCKELSFDAGTSVTNTLSITSGVGLTVTGTITVPQTSIAGANILAVGAGSLVAENLDFTATTGGAGHQLTISTGTVTITANITGIGAASTITFTDAGLLQIGGALFASGEGTLTTVGGSTVEYMGTSQTVQSHTYNNLLISGTGTKTFAGTTANINNNLTVNPGTSLTVPGVTLAVAGVTTVDGTLSFTSTTGTKTFTGLVTVNGTWSNTSESITFNGGITNNGTFTAGTGTYTFAINSQTLTGNFVIRTVTVTGALVELTNTNSLTASTALSGTGRLIQGSGATLNIGGTSTITGLTATALNNTVNYTSATAQTVKAVNYFNLGLSGGGTKTLAEATANIGGDLTTGGTVTVTAVTGLTIGGTLAVGAGSILDGGNFIHTVAGDLDSQGNLSSTGTILMNGADQSITGVSGTYHNLTFSGTGTKFLGASTVLSGTLSIESGVAASLEGIATHQANTLILGGALQSATGTWGGLASGAANINTVFFTASGGVITIATGGNMFYSRVSGDWSDPATWSNTDYNGAAASSIPALGDYVFIGGGRTVTLSAAGVCTNITFDAGTAVTNTLVVDAGGALQVQDISIPQTITSGSNNLNITSGTLQADNLDFVASTNGAGHKLSIGTGSALFNENITGIGSTSTIEFTGAGTLSLNGAIFSPAEGTLTTVSGSIVEYTGTAAQTVQAFNYNHLLLTDLGIKTMTGTSITVNGNLTVDVGSTLVIPGVSLTVSGATLVDGALTLSTSNAGSKTFVGLVTVNGTWTNSINESLVFRGGLTNNGTFNSGTGIHTFNTNSQSLIGTFSIARVTITGASVVLTNSNNLTVGTALTGTGQLTQAPGAILNLAGTATVTNLDATASNNVVNYSGTVNQTLKGVSYYHLYLSGSGVKTFQAGTSAISGDLILSGTVSTASVPSITIGGELNVGNGTTFTAPASVQLAGNFIDDGSYVHSSGVLTLNGTSDQSISGSSVTNFYSLSVADAVAARTVSVITSKNLLNVLTLGENIIFDADGAGSAEFSLRSLSGTETQDGTIGPIPATSSVTGVVRIERRMSPEINVWRYISSPVQGVTISQFTDDMQAILQSVRWYNEALINKASRWSSLTSSGEALVAGRGYETWMYQNVEIDWDVTGTINQGAFTWSTANGRLTSSTGTSFTDDDKWNLIGNPYPSSIQWDGNPANWTISPDLVATTVYVPDESAGVVRAYNYADGSGDDGSGSSFPILTDGVIATGQSFWVYVLPGASITIEESAKVPSNQGAGHGFYRKSANALNQLSLRLAQNGSYDEAYFKLNENATRDLDMLWDAPKFFNEKLNIYFIDDDNRSMGMHTLPDLVNEREIRVGYRVLTPGTYSFSVAFKGQMDELNDWYLLDRYTNQRTVLADMSNYEVTITESALADNGRFALVKGGSVETLLKLYPSPATNALNVNAPAEIIKIEIVDVQGNVRNARAVYLDSYTATIDILDLKPGLYILKAFTEAGVSSEKFIKK